MKKYFLLMLPASSPALSLDAEDGIKSEKKI